MLTSNMNYWSPLVVILLLASFVSLPRFIDAFVLSSACSRANSLQNVSPDFCLTSLQVDPKSTSANLTGLLQNSINLTIKNTTDVMSQVRYLLSDSTYAHLKEGLSCCQISYSSAINSLSEALDQISKKPSKQYKDNTRSSLGDAQDSMVYCMNYCDIDPPSILAKKHENAYELIQLAFFFCDELNF